FFSSRRRHTRSKRDWSSDVCSSDLGGAGLADDEPRENRRQEPDPRQQALGGLERRGERADQGVQLAVAQERDAEGGPDQHGDQQVHGAETSHHFSFLMEGARSTGGAPRISRLPTPVQAGSGSRVCACCALSAPGGAPLSVDDDPRVYLLSAGN